MKIAVAARGDGLHEPADPRFGRCTHFVVADTEGGEPFTVPNPGAAAGSGAGIQAAQVVADAGAEAVIAGNYGPNAVEALAAGGIDAYLAIEGTVAEVIEAWNSGQLERAS